MIYALTVFLPLIGAAIAGLFGRFIGDRASAVICCAALVLAGLLSIPILIGAIGAEPHKVHLFTWMVSGNFEADWQLRIDALSAVMIFVVTVVSALIHIYSIGYMAHDDSIPRFFSYLSLFTFFMLALVTSDNLLQLYFGWEGVGLASYLLIGFWYLRPSANAAAIKAFIVNRVGDFGFALGIAGCFLVFDSIELDVIFAEAARYAGTQVVFFGITWDTLTILCVLLFIGAMGKSAQLFLHTWLPDAMEGPTPVSALIHAATMVTAGVFLVARMSPMFEYAPAALALVTVIGAATAFFAATIGLVQNDIKRVIAYSTCSQLGYMFFACGVGAYAAGIFHLYTHAFFKALLFLGAGSVIHAMSDEQDMQKMGGIWRKVPITYAVMWVGALALAGIPIFAGYFSKDIILEAAYMSGAPFGMFAFWLGLAAAVLTAFYSWRLLFLTFHGESRASKEVMDHVHESPPVMTVPLILLALGAVFAGLAGLPMVAADGAFWGGAIHTRPENVVLEAAHHAPSLVAVSPVVMGLVGIAVAYLLYIARPELPAQLAERLRPLYLFLYNKWYFDEIYDAVFVRPAMRIGRVLWQGGDLGVIDRYGPDGVALTAVQIARRAVRLQTGYLYHYAFAMLIGVAALVTWYLLAVRG